MNAISFYTGESEFRKCIERTIEEIAKFDEVTEIFDIFEHMYYEVLENMQESLIEASIHRLEHDWYNLEPDVYRKLAMCGEIPSIESDLNFKFEELVEMVQRFLDDNHYFYENQLGFVNAPLQEVW